MVKSEHAGHDSPRRILAGMFCVGFVSLCMQVLLLREFLIAFYGNEITIGIILSSWLLGVGLGALFGRWLLPHFPLDRSSGTMLGLLLLWMGCFLPMQVLAVRGVRLAMALPPGELVSLGRMIGATLGILVPGCGLVGFCFPLACRALLCTGKTAFPDVCPVGNVYAIEAAGSTVGGLVLTFVLIPLCSSVQLVVIVCGAACAGASFLLASRCARHYLRLLAAGVLLIGCYRPFSFPVEERLLQIRWQGFGVMGDRDGTLPSVRLVASFDSRYQNLAVIESQGQYSLYGNGEIIFSFPDAYEYEHAVHTIMPQHPACRSILLLGANPVGELPQVLKYPLQRVVCVDLDPEVGAMVAAVQPRQYARVRADPRVRFVYDDAGSFVRDCRERFDMILVMVPSPTTAALNRFYSVEFYRSLARLLAPGGIVVSSVEASERLLSEATPAGASVFHAMREVFEQVLTTGVSPYVLFAGDALASLTLDRETLYDRAMEQKVPTDYFRPEYFLGTDALDPEKIRFVREKFMRFDGVVNRCMRPVTYYYHQLLWSRFSGSAGGRIQQFLSRGLSAPWRVVRCMLPAALVLFMGAWLSRHVWGGRMASTWVRGMTCMLVASSGFCGMALEITVLFLFQSLFGFVYARVGLLVAVFMLGLVCGAQSGLRIAKGRGGGRTWLLHIEVGLGLFALLLAWGGHWMVSGLDASAGGFVETLFYLSVGLIGWAVGTEFPLANRLLLDVGSTATVAAGSADAFDHLGAALGALLTGVLLLPALGVTGTLVFLAGVKALSLVGVLSALPGVPRHARSN